MKTKLLGVFATMILASCSEGTHSTPPPVLLRATSSYNSLFPLCAGIIAQKHVVGCANVAIDRIMSHFEIPKTIADPIDPADPIDSRISRTLKWAEIKANPHAPNLKACLFTKRSLCCL